MKKLIQIIALSLMFISVKAQQPSGLPNTKSTGWIQYSYVKTDSGQIMAVRDTNWIAKYVGTSVFWQHAGVDSAAWIYNGSYWVKQLSGAVSGTGTVTNLSQGWGIINSTNPITTSGSQRVDSNAIKAVMDGNYWKNTGNSSTVSGTNFIGTTDSVDLVFKTKSLERARFNARGALGLGTGTNYGTSGYLMQTNGAGSAPTWVNPNSAVTLTWQDVLNNGSTLAGANTIDMDGNEFNFNNSSGFRIAGAGVNFSLTAGTLGALDSCVNVEQGLWGKRGVRFSGLIQRSLDTINYKIGVFDTNGDMSKMYWPTGGGTTYTGTLPVTVTGSVISMPKASATDSGWVSTGRQTIAGSKQLTDSATIETTVASASALSLKSTAASYSIGTDVTWLRTYSTNNQSKVPRFNIGSVYYPNVNPTPGNGDSANQVGFFGWNADSRGSVIDTSKAAWVYRNELNYQRVAWDSTMQSEWGLDWSSPSRYGKSFRLLTFEPEFSGKNIRSYMTATDFQIHDTSLTAYLTIAPGSFTLNGTTVTSPQINLAGTLSDAALNHILKYNTKAVASANVTGGVSTNLYLGEGFVNTFLNSSHIQIGSYAGTGVDVFPITTHYNTIKTYDYKTLQIQNTGGNTFTELGNGFLENYQNQVLRLNRDGLGVIISKMTTATRASVGLVSGVRVYNTTVNKDNLYNGTSWLTPVYDSDTASMLTNYVTTNTTQSITGAKTFSLDATVNTVRVGLGNGSKTDNTAIGVTALNAITNGVRNTGLGYKALFAVTTGNDNTAIGQSAGSGIQAGLSNIAIGSNAGKSIDAGSNNILIMYNGITSGGNNILIGGDGVNATTGITTGSYNTVIGQVTGLSTSLANNIILADGQNHIKAQNNGTDWTLTGSVGISTSPVASALLDLTSTTKGLLIPRMTTTQRNAISSPATGLKVFNTTDSSEYTYRGTTGGWQAQPFTLTATATLDFASTAASTSTDLTITVTGAADGDAVSIGVPNAAVSANSAYTAWVSAANTVTIRFNNYQVVGSIDPASATFRATVIKY